uniref:Peptidase M12B domain-containing protein n=1 Tax=Amblyomma maculatum TaxID=34609 RepID=G3MQE8_AMBMU
MEQLFWRKSFIWYVSGLICVFAPNTESLKLPYGHSLVFPHVIHSRSDNISKTLKITKTLTLNLEKSSVLDKELLLRTYEGPLMRHTYIDGEMLEEDLYHESQKFASVMVSEENGLKVEGVLGPKLRIKPWFQDSAVGKTFPHIVYEIEDDTIHERKGGSWDKMAMHFTPRESYPQGAEVPKAGYPEILIAVDNTLRVEFHSEEELLKYVIILVNSMNVRYLTISKPSVQLKLRAIEIFNAKDDYSLFYIVDDVAVAYPSLEKLRDYVYYNPSKYSEYDLVFLFTGKDLVSRRGRGWERSIQGIAFIGGACGYEKVALGEDRAGTHKGVRVGAHEIGHLLGCPHDGYAYGRFSSEGCQKNGGFIMSYVERDSQSMKFSKCCNEMIRKMVISPEGKCLREKNVRRKIEKSRFPKKLPGDVVNRDKICKLAFPDVPETHFMVGSNGDAQCHARCFMPERLFGSDTFRYAFLFDNSPCNASEGRQTRPVKGLRSAAPFIETLPSVQLVVSTLSDHRDIQYTHNIYTNAFGVRYIRPAEMSSSTTGAAVSASAGPVECGTQKCWEAAGKHR